MDTALLAPARAALFRRSAHRTLPAHSGRWLVHLPGILFFTLIVVAHLSFRSSAGARTAPRPDAMRTHAYFLPAAPTLP
ncbi:MAG TPA: hypothetical protein VGE21_09395 [Flavobacteriales bacterium]